jgi:hypothetical protein
MYPFPVGLALMKLIAERPDRRYIHEGRLEQTARLARQGRGDYDAPAGRPLPRRRSRRAWLFGTRDRAVA